MNIFLHILSPFLISNILLFQAMASNYNSAGENTMQLELVDIDDLLKNKFLTTPMVNVAFPLNEEEKRFIGAMKSKVTELGAAGLAAPQLGVAKPITTFEVSPEALKWREDITHFVPLTVLINPSYEPIESEGRTLDWEGCLSGKNYYGKVWRYAAVWYYGQDINGNNIEGKAQGFLARLLQHEIDHCHGKMCVHKYPKDYPYGTQQDLMPLRKEEMRQRKEKLGLAPEDPFPFMKIK